MKIDILMMVALYSLTTTSHTRGTRPKRISRGQAMMSEADYNTYHFVHIRNEWACVFRAWDHVPVGDCWEDGFCGGTLIRPDFVLTACHCTEDIELFLRQEDFDFIEGAVGHKRLVHRLFSNVGLFMGSTNYFKMSQKRHAERIFNHQACYPGDERTIPHGEYGDYHDASLIMPCQPFEIDAFVRLAPMKPLRELKEQFDEIVRKGTTCLYVGMTAPLSEGTRVLVPGKPGQHVDTEWLLYVWRPTDCQSKCVIHPIWNDTKCSMCSTHLGGKLGLMSSGDSGGPVICEGYYVAIMYNGMLRSIDNYTDTENYPIQCLRHYLDDRHLAYLRTLEAGGLHRTISGERFLRRLRV